jgi:hypothetical protein
MFKKIATFEALQAWRIAPGPIGAAHSNYNLPEFRRPADGRCARPKLALACHWYLIGGRLECRWDIGTPDGTPMADFEPQPAAGRAVGPPVVQPRHNLWMRATG